MTTPRIVLHEWGISPFCGKVRAILDVKRLPYETVDYGGLRALAVRRVSASGKLPVLDYGDERLEDSSTIARVLEARHPSPRLIPEDREQRALVHFFEDWADESLYWFEVYLRVEYPDARRRAADLAATGTAARALMHAGLRRLRPTLRAQGLGRYPRTEVEARLRDHLDQLDTRLAHTGWLVGSSLTLADLAVAAQLQEIERTSHLAGELTARPALSAWLRAIAAARV